jgi:5-methylcytosine-specific restriction endonuclease McrBC regulatory subunit McrC
VDLANDVIKGLGLSFREGFAAAPGYIVGTWRTWEDLLVVAMRLAYGRNVVRAQAEHKLGSRIRFPESSASSVNVYPDLTVACVDGLPSFVIDAKYKANVDKGRQRISEADAYEAFAFGKATGCDTVILAYPALPSSKLPALGETRLFERLDIKDVKIYGVEIEVRGIARRSGLKTFSTAVRKGFEAAIRPA